MTTPDELRRLERAATAGPWQEFAESGDWWIAGVDADGGPLGSVCNSDVGDRGTWARQEDVDLVVAARNALPALLAVVEAAKELADATLNAPGTLSIEQRAMTLRVMVALAALDEVTR